MTKKLDFSISREDCYIETVKLGEAMIAYARFPKLNQSEFKHKYQKLVEYCKQDTWAMYEVLRGLKKEVGYQEK